MGSVRMSYIHARDLLCTTFVQNTACHRNFFQIVSQKNAQIVNIKVDAKNPLWVWILRIHDPFLDLPPPKNT